MQEKAAKVGDVAAGQKSPGIGAAAPGAAAPPRDWQALSVTNLPEATSLLTETEKFFFDLRGCLLLHRVVEFLSGARGVFCDFVVLFRCC